MRKFYNQFKFCFFHVLFIHGGGGTHTPHSTRIEGKRQLGEIGTLLSPPSSYSSNTGQVSGTLPTELPDLPRSLPLGSLGE